MTREAGAILLLVGGMAAAVSLAFAGETAGSQGSVGAAEASGALAALGTPHPAAPLRLPGPSLSLGPPDPPVSLPAPEGSLDGAPDPDGRLPAPNASATAQAAPPLPPDPEGGGPIRVAALVNGALAGAAIAALALSQMNRREPLP